MSVGLVMGQQINRSPVKNIGEAVNTFSVSITTVPESNVTKHNMSVPETVESTHKFIPAAKSVAFDELGGKLLGVIWIFM